MRCRWTIQIERALARECQANSLATIHARHTKLYRGAKVSMVMQVELWHFPMTYPYIVGNQACFRRISPFASCNLSILAWTSCVLYACEERWGQLRRYSSRAS